MLVAIPTYLLEEIDRKLDEAIKDCPDAEKDRGILRTQLIAYLDEHGVIPDFKLGRKE